MFAFQLDKTSGVTLSAPPFSALSNVHPLDRTKGQGKDCQNQYDNTANPNPVQLTGKPCKSIPTGKYLLSLQGNPVLIAVGGSLFALQGFPCISLYFPVRDCSAEPETFF